MADIRDWGSFIRTRWDWTKNGYEIGFPRHCAFTDVDAAIEFDGRFLLIEAKQNDGLAPIDMPPAGQLMALRREVQLGKTVLILYGCGVCNSPQAVRILGTPGELLDWRGRPLTERRLLLKAVIDNAMGVVKPPGDEYRSGPYEGTLL